MHRYLLRKKTSTPNSMFAGIQATHSVLGGLIRPDPEYLPEIYPIKIILSSKKRYKQTFLNLTSIL
jgi:hypothetical protein